MFAEVPVIELSMVSVAVIDSVGVVLNVTEKVPTPAASVESAGKTAEASELVKWTVPAYAVVVLP